MPVMTPKSNASSIQTICMSTPYILSHISSFWRWWPMYYLHTYLSPFSNLMKLLISLQFPRTFRFWLFKIRGNICLSFFFTIHEIGMGNFWFMKEEPILILTSKTISVNTNRECFFLSFCLSFFLSLLLFLKISRLKLLKSSLTAPWMRLE